jgi:hypothetical protein
MEAQKLITYRFINRETGYVIGYLSMSTDTPEDEKHASLEKRKKELAVTHKIFEALIYWESPPAH